MLSGVFFGQEFPDYLSVILLPAGLLGCVAVLGGVFCAVVAALYFSGLLKIKCPLCGAASKMGGHSRGLGPGRRSYTYLICPNCGEVHASGFFRNRYTSEKGPGKSEGGESGKP